MDINEEKEIIEEIRETPKLFGLLFDAYYPTIYRYILKRVADHTIAQDIASETFLKALKNIQKFKWQNISICHWFYAIASNELRMFYRKNNYKTDSLENLYETISFEPRSDQDVVEELIEAQHTLEQRVTFLEAQKILARLPVKYQEVIALRFMEEKQIREISYILDKKEGTIKSLLSRGLVKLRKELEAQQMQPTTSECIDILEVNEIVTITTS